MQCTGATNTTKTNYYKRFLFVIFSREENKYKSQVINCILNLNNLNTSMLQQDVKLRRITR